MVLRLLLGADGVALRARGHEPRLDGVHRRVDRGREADPVAAPGDGRDGGDPPHARTAASSESRGDPRSHAAARRTDAADGRDDPVGAYPPRDTSRFVRSSSSWYSSASPSSLNGPRFARCRYCSIHCSRARSTKPIPCSSLYRLSFATSLSRLFTSSTSALSTSDNSRRTCRTKGSSVTVELIHPPRVLRRRRGHAAHATRP